MNILFIQSYGITNKEEIFKKYSISDLVIYKNLAYCQGSYSTLGINTHYLVHMKFPWKYITMENSIHTVYPTKSTTEKEKKT